MSLTVEHVGEEFVEDFADDFPPHPHDQQSSAGKPWEGMLGIPTPGRMRAKRRGKLLTIIAGNVSEVLLYSSTLPLKLPTLQRNISVHSALEGTAVGMTRDQFNRIIAHDELRPSGKHHQYSNYSFQIPDTREFVTIGSAPKPRRANIFAAIVSDDWVWALVDQQRLLRCHLRLRKQPWTVSDLNPNSVVSIYLFLILGPLGVYRDFIRGTTPCGDLMVVGRIGWTS